MTFLPSFSPTQHDVASSQRPYEDFVKWHGKIKTNPFRRNKNKYCEFHKDYGHNIEDYL